MRPAYPRIGYSWVRKVIGYEVRHAAREKLLDLGLGTLHHMECITWCITGVHHMRPPSHDVASYFHR